MITDHDASTQCVVLKSFLRRFRSPAPGMPPPPMNRSAPSPFPSPPGGERVASRRVRGLGFRGSRRESFRGILSPQRSAGRGDFEPGRFVRSAPRSLSPPAWPKPLRRGEGPALSSTSRRRGSLVRSPRCTLVLAALFCAPAWNTPANDSVHTSWLWHLHQPIYWPDRRNYGADHYENAWDTIQQQDGGRQHPSPEILRNIFGLDDRRNAYQSGPSNSLYSILGYPKSGVQISYSGALMENVQSLGAAGQLGYGGNWYQWNRSARRWTTTAGKPRMDLVNFTYHHALAPLISDETLE